MINPFSVKFQPLHDFGLHLLCVWSCAGPVSGPPHAAGYGLSLEPYGWDQGGLWYDTQRAVFCPPPFLFWMTSEILELFLNLP